MKTCQHCQKPFEIFEEDKAFYERLSPEFAGQKIPLSEPTLCPNCRQQRRISWRNDRSLYHRECSKTGKRIISVLSPDKPMPVFDNDLWWSDDWSALDYGRDYDFSRPFFEQWQEFQNTVPHVALAIVKAGVENSDFCNQITCTKDCYLIYDSRFSERCFYGKTVERSYDCIDCFKVFDCEACYEVDNAHNCQWCTYCWNIQNSSTCHYSANLIGCKDCYGCVNLRNKQYYFFNQPCRTQEEYEQKVSNYVQQHSRQKILEQFLEFWKSQPQKWMQEQMTENCSGDYLFSCKNSHFCYDSEYLEDCRYCYDLKKDSGINYANYDVTHFGGSVEECYECCSIGNGMNRTMFCENVWSSGTTLYSRQCHQTKDCFACIALRNKQYCIFNKQYSKEEYEELMPRILRHMTQTKEWGEYFPTAYSPYAYNETLAYEYFPLSKEETLNKGWKWKDEDVTSGYQGPEYVPPANIANVPSDITEKILVCEVSKKPYKIIPQELRFYKKMKLSIPRRCPDQRHRDRLARRNPRMMWKRGCSQCQQQISSSFAPNRKELVYCERCYLQSVI